MCNRSGPFHLAAEVWLTQTFMLMTFCVFKKKKKKGSSNVKAR